MHLSLADYYRNQKLDEKAFQEEMQKKIMDGNKPIDIRSAMPKGGIPERYHLEKKIDGDIKKELYLIVPSAFRSIFVLL